MEKKKKGGFKLDDSITKSVQKDKESAVKEKKQSRKTTSKK